MAGIDDIGGQVMPGQEDVDLNMPPFRSRNGSFYHYGLGKLGSSAAAIERNGDSMCEIFGAYGWAEGVRLEKYLLDHFMVRGINHFVPSCIFRKRLSGSGLPAAFLCARKQSAVPAFRRADGIWKPGAGTDQRRTAYCAGCDPLPRGKRLDGETMASDIVGHQFYDDQIDYDYIPQDVFLEENAYDMEISRGRSG